MTGRDRRISRIGAWTVAWGLLLPNKLLVRFPRKTWLARVWQICVVTEG
jgi:hypothetical protein